MGNVARLAGLVAVALAGCLAAACTSGAGTPAPTSSPSVPTIAGDPLDLTRQAARPCTLLRADQLAQYHLVAPGTEDGAACAWQPSAAGLPSYRASVDLTSGGLVALYRKRAQLPVFQPIKVGDYPGVNTAASPAAQRHGQCTVDVAVAGDTLVVAAVTVPPADQLDYADPCPNVDQFAGSIVANGEGKVP